MNKKIAKFIPRFEDQSNDTYIDGINLLISKDSIMPLKHSGAFTSHSVVLGTEHDTAWLLKINDETKPANTHIHDELDSTEAAASEYGRSVGLSDLISFSIDGKVVYSDGTEAGCVAVKFFNDDYITAVDAHRIGEKILRDNIIKLVQNNKLIKIATFLYIIGDIDCNGNNILCNMNDIKFIDFGLAFADDRWSPVPHDVPYFMRFLKEEAWNAISIDLDYQRDFKFWVAFLKEDTLKEVCIKYGVNHEGPVHRLHLIKDSMSSNNIVKYAWNLWNPDFTKTETLEKAPFINTDDDFSLSQGAGWSQTEKPHFKSYKLPDDTIVHHHKDNDGSYFTVTDNDKHNGKAISYMQVDHHNPITGEDAPYVNAIHTIPEYRNQGYGKALYDTAIHHYKTLNSDQRLTTASQHMWSKLSHDPKYTVEMGMKNKLDQHQVTLNKPIKVPKIGKSEELIKAPISYDDGELAQSWQEYPRSNKRAELHQSMIHPSKHHDRVAMIKGLGKETKKKKIDGTWHLKLYRGVSEGEHPDDYKTEAKSFTSNKKVAQNFANQYGGEAVEQWVPINHISYSFNHAHLADGPQNNEHAHEGEVIVGPKHE